MMRMTHSQQRFAICHQNYSDMCRWNVLVLKVLTEVTVCPLWQSQNVSSQIFFLQILFCGKYEDWAATTNTYAEIQLVTLTFDLAFRWAKVRSKYRLKSKSKVVSLSQSLRPNFALSERLSQKLKWLSANTSHVPLLLHHSKRTRVHLSSLCELYSRVPHVRLHR